MQANRSMGLGEWGLLLLLAGLWGGSFFFGKVALTELRPFSIVLGRVSLAALALNLLVVYRRLRMPRTPGIWLAFFVMGGLNNLIPFSLIFWGQTRIASGLASILNATTPLFTVVLCHCLTRDERLTPNRLAGVVAGIAGVAALTGPVAMGGLTTGLIAQVAVLAAALSYAFAGLYGRRFKDLPPLVTATGQLTATSVMILPIAIWFDLPWLDLTLSWQTCGSIIGLALLSTALAYVIYFRLLATAGATNLLLVTFLIPITAILLGTIVLGEPIEWRQCGGMALIACGLAAIDGRIMSLPSVFRKRANIRRQAGRQPAEAGESY